MIILSIFYLIFWINLYIIHLELTGASCYTFSFKICVFFEFNI